MLAKNNGFAPPMADGYLAVVVGWTL